MKIGIDARFLTHPQRGGFKTYTENLIASLAQVDSENEYVLYLDRPQDETTNLPERANFIPRVVRDVAPVVGMPRREQIKLTAQATRDKVDLLHSPSLTAPLFLSCPSVVTIHDMIWYSPNKFCNDRSQPLGRKMMQLYYRVVPEWAARHAAAILTVSNAAKESIVQQLNIPSDRVFVTHEAANQIYRSVQGTPELDALRSKFNLPARFVLAIGSADPRKNITSLIEAYARLPVTLRAEYKLVIVWTHDLLEMAMGNLIARLGLNDDVYFLNDVSNDNLVLLYNTASLFVFPSLYEGFGLPLLEAMACGTAVLACNNSSIPEIVGDAAMLVDAPGADAIAWGMCRLLTDDILRQDLAGKGRARATNFSWNKCARQTLEVYEQAFAMRRVARRRLDAYPS